MIKRLFSPPAFESEEDNFRAKFINGFAWIVILLLSAALSSYLPDFAANRNATVSTIAITGLIFVMFLALYFLRKRNLNLSGGIVVVLGWLGLGIQAFFADGVKDVVIIAYIAISLLASIIISWRVGAFFIALSIGAIWALGLLEINGYLTPHFQDTITYSRDISFVFIAIAVLIYFSTASLRDAITRASKSEKNLLASNTSLLELNQTLEDRVNQRTTELEAANRFNQKRARQFEAISKTVRAVSSIQDLESLLPQVTKVISEQFNIYHAGIFLLDENREYAVLRAANSEGGKKMLARGHKLAVGQTGIVGFVTATGQPRLALDVGADATFFNNPDMPNTHSEVALPLKHAGMVIGALDVQSDESNAFDQDDVSILTILADQVATAINNTLTLEDALKEVSLFQSSLDSKTLEAWKVMRPKSLGLGYQLTGSSVEPLGAPLEGSHVRQAFKQNKPVEGGDSSAVAIPIQLRGRTVGVINLQAGNNYRLTNDDVEIAQAVVERLSLAIETATLLQATQHRADIERLTTDISSKISSSTRFETILQTAAQELSRALGGSDVLVQIEPVSIELSMLK